MAPFYHWTEIEATGKKVGQKADSFQNVSTCNTLVVTCGQQWPHSQLSARRVVFTGELQNWAEISWFSS